MEVCLMICYVIRRLNLKVIGWLIGWVVGW